MLNNKEHKKIARQKRRINTLSIGLIIKGISYIVLALAADYLASQLKIRTNPSFGGGQWLLLIWGVAHAIWGWRIR